jgi:PhzF family phenazine biosynthesis protein
MQSIVVVDAFTDKPFAGNPAAVCVMERPADETWMKNVAAEMNLSESAFLYPEDEGWRLRWLTPTVEVDLCGHATLASAHVLFDTGRANGVIRFCTRSGELTARQVNGMIELDFPAQPPKACDPPNGLLDALGAKALFVGNNGTDYFVEVENEVTVRQLQPNHALLAKLPVRGVIVTGPPTTSKFDFVSRFFAPGSGIDEDPVTGSAHCCLGPYWSERLKKTDLIAYQASSRGGIVHVGVRGDRITLAGHAVTVWKGGLVV